MHSTKRHTARCEAKEKKLFFFLLLSQFELLASINAVIIAHWLKPHAIEGVTPGTFGCACSKIFFTSHMLPNSLA
jgi:hypothetical protein